MRRLIISSVAALALSASAASATVLRIVDILDDATNGFGYSLFHSQESGQMNGTLLEDPDVLSPGGTWNTTTGAIQFVFSLAGGGTVSAIGNLMTGVLFGSPNQYIAVGGTIDMTFAGANDIQNGTQTFTFDLGQLNVGGANFPANGAFFPSFAQLNLWGDNGQYPDCNSGPCIGLDLGLQLAPIPLPAAGLLLVGALGGLGFVGRRKRKAA